MPLSVARIKLNPITRAIDDASVGPVSSIALSRSLLQKSKLIQAHSFRAIWFPFSLYIFSDLSSAQIIISIKKKCDATIYLL